MRVLHVLNELRFSGAEMMLATAAAYWQEQGIHGEVLSKGQHAGAFRLELERAGYAIHHVPYRSLLTFVRPYAALIRTGRYDVIHVHAEHLNIVTAGLPALLGVSKVFRTVHNAFHFEGRTRHERRLQRRVLRSLGVEHVSISPSVEHAERANFDNRTHHIPNWYNSTHFRPPTPAERREARSHLGIPHETFVLASVANCGDAKNHGSMLRALATAPTDREWLYLHAGAEQDGYPERSLAKALGIAEAVRFMGPVRNVRRVLWASDVYVMPSLYEGAPIAAMEAMGAGLPAIFADVPGLRDFRDMECQGISWVEPTPASIARAVHALSDMPPADRRRIGRTLSTAIGERHGIERGASAYAELYASECAKRAPRSAQQKGG